MTNSVPKSDRQSHAFSVFKSKVGAYGSVWIELIVAETENTVAKYFLNV